MLADQSGNALLALPDKWQDKPVTLDVKEMPYFQALDFLCALTGLTYQVKDQSLALVSPPEASDVGVYLGPGTVKMAQLIRNRAFRNASNPQSTSLQLSLCAFWEDRLPVVFNSFDVAKVTTADGRQLEMRTRKGAPPAYAIGRYSYGAVTSGQAPAVKPSLSAAPAFAMLQNLPDKLGKTLTIEGTFRLDIGSGEKVLSIPKVLVEGDRSAEAGEVSFRIKEVHTSMPTGGMVGFWDSRVKNPVSFVIELRRPSREPIAGMGGSSPYGVFLVKADGKRFPPLSFMGAQQLKDDAWVATVSAFFDKPEGMDDTWSLVYVYPEKQESKEWPFKLENVPLP
jgi:hypothetical protein